MANEAVKTFLEQHNRPYSAIDIQNSIGKEFGKAAIQKALDKLVDKNAVIEKVYGKQKVYCITQQDDSEPQNFEEDLKKMDREINEVAINLKTCEDQLQKSTATLRGLQGQMTLDEARAEYASLSEAVAALNTCLAELPEYVVSFSDKEKDKINSEHEQLVKEYRKRKRICIDMVNAIMEGYPKTKKHLFEEVGIETDEDAGFKLISN